MEWKKTLKELIKYNWFPYLMALILIFSFLFRVQIDTLIYASDPKYCGNYKELRILWENDTNKAFCVLNCGVERGCNNTNMGGPYYNNITHQCICLNGMVIEYDPPRFGDIYDENFTVKLE